MAFRTWLATATLAFVIGGPAAAQAPPVLVDEFVVNGRLPGPAWWRVSDGDSVVHVMAVPTITPKGLTFDTGPLERRLDGANRLILPTKLDAQPMRLMATALADRKALLRDRPFDASLSPSLRARVDARIRAVAADAESGFYLLPPAMVGWIVAVGEQNSSTTYGAVPDAIEALARKAPHAPRIVPTSSYGLPGLLHAMATLPQAEAIACLEAGVRQSEDAERATSAVATRWANGDVRAFSTADPGFQACFDAMPYTAEAARRSVDASTRAIAAALKTPGKSVAIVEFNPLLSQDGVLDRLRRQGFEVTTPGEIGS